MSLPEAQDLHESIVVHDKGSVEGAVGHDILAAPESKSLSSRAAQITGRVRKEFRFDSEVHNEHASQVLLNLLEPVSVSRLLESSEFIFWNSWEQRECRSV
jgi:hypothetical protein